MAREYRKLFLQNAAGDRIDLNGAQGIYAADLTGLGVTLAPVYGNLQRGFFTVLDDRSKPQTAAGMTLIFTRRDQAYQDYQELTRWIAAAGDGLRLVYRPWGSTDYYRRVVLSYVRKTEKTNVGWLRCPTEWKPLTPWYLPTAVQISMTPETAATMRYAFRYGTARYAASHAPAYAATLQPSGDQAAGIRLTFAGEAIRPVLTLTGLETGTVHGRVVLDVELETGDELQFSSVPGDAYWRLISAGETTELDDILDPGEDPFPMLPLSEPCTLQLTGQTIDGSAAVSLAYYFDTV